MKEINQLDEKVTLDVNDVFPIDSIEGATKQVTFSNLQKSIGKLPFVVVGTTGDCDYICYGASDDAVIQTAIDNMISVGGGTIYVKPGTYHLSSNLLIVGNDITIRGAGTATQFVLDDEVNRECIVVGDAVTSCNRVNFYDFALDGNGENQTADDPAYALGTRNLIRYRSDSQNCYGGVVQGIYAHDSKQNGISLESQSYITVRDCICKDNGQHGIWWENGSQVNIINNYTEHNTLGGIKAYSVSGGTIEGNISKSELNASFIGLTCKAVTWANNISYRPGWTADATSAAYGFYLTACDYCTVIGNSVYGSQGHGMQLYNMKKTTVSHNTFRLNGQKTDNTYSDIYITNGGGATTVSDCNICNNTFDNTPVTYYENTAKYNIDFVQTSTHVNNIVSENNFGDPATAKIHNPTDNKISNNDGWVTENSGLATVANGQTSIVVTHGLSVTPTADDIMVTPTNTMGNAAKYYIGTFTATQFTITVNTDPGASTAQFAWKAIVL